jgi:hypothetical protein
MNEPVFVWTAVIYALLLVLLILSYRRKRRLSAEVHAPQGAVVTMRNALEDWLHEERIVRVMVQTRTATVAELQVTLLAVPSMTRTQLCSTCEALLRERMVRRVIAAWMWQRYRADQRRVLAALAEWAKPVPQRRSA